MRPIEDLIDSEEPGWPLVQEWIAASRNKVEVLACAPAEAKVALVGTQVTTRSPMGAIVYSTGGILVDDGWIRILGAGSERLPSSLPEWNLGKSLAFSDEKPGFYLVADDVIGGGFAINGGALGTDVGKVYYLAPDTLEWEAMGRTYSEFLEFCFLADLDQFYGGYRWIGWRTEVATLPGDQSFNFFPPLFTKEGKDSTMRSRKAIAAAEQYFYTLDMRTQLRIEL